MMKSSLFRPLAFALTFTCHWVCHKSEHLVVETFVTRVQLTLSRAPPSVPGSELRVVTCVLPYITLTAILRCACL